MSSASTRVDDGSAWELSVYSEWNAKIVALLLPCILACTGSHARLLDRKRRSRHALPLCEICKCLFQTQKKEMGLNTALSLLP